MNSKVSNKITYLNFALAFLILNLHSAYMELFDSNNIVLMINQAVKVICNMAVPTFFFLSAMLFYRSCEKKKYIDVIITKVKTLLIPYICWNVICFPLKEFKNYMEFSALSFDSPIELVWNILSSSYDPVLWFIRVLFIYILLYPVNLYILKKKRVYPFIIILMVVINIIIGPTIGYATCRYWLPVYMLGAYVGYWYKQEVFESSAIRPKYGRITIAIVITSIMVLWATFDSYGLFIFRMISPVLYWVIADVYLILKRPNWILKQSFFFYCSQMIFSVFAQKIYIKLFGTGEISAIISNIGIPCILLVILMCVAYLFNKILPKTYCFLTGGRA